MESLHLFNDNGGSVKFEWETNLMRWASGQPGDNCEPKIEISGIRRQTFSTHGGPPKPSQFLRNAHSLPDVRKAQQKHPAATTHYSGPHKVQIGHASTHTSILKPQSAVIESYTDETAPIHAPQARLPSQQASMEKLVTANYD